MRTFKKCPGKFSVESGRSHSVGSLGVSLPSSVSACLFNGTTSKSYHRGLLTSGSLSGPGFRCTRKTFQCTKNLLVMIYPAKHLHGNAAAVTHAVRSIVREPNLEKLFLPTLEHKCFHHSKEQRRISGPLTNYRKLLSKAPALVSAHRPLNSRIGVPSKSSPHRIGQTNRYYSSDACVEPITGQPGGPGGPGGPGEYAGIGPPGSLIQKKSPESAPSLGDPVVDQSPYASSPEFWSHSSHKSPDGKDIIVHYCKSLKNMEKIAKYFSEEKVLGFDMEWKAQASASDSLQSNVSLIQIASRSRIALFQVAMFKPARSVKDLVAPSLKKILESPDITKVGVSIKADCTRLRKYLNINARAIFELSHLHKLVKYCHSNPHLINKRLVSLNDQVEEHFGLPLVKDDSVRCSDWTVSLSYPQVQYAATDPYACICLYDALNAKRESLYPMPPLPAHAELDLPIRVVDGSAENIDSNDVQIVDQKEEPPAKEDT